MVPSALGMTYGYGQAVTAHADDAVLKKVAQTNPNVSEYPGFEPKILKDIDCFDSEISSQQKEIGKLLDL